MPCIYAMSAYMFSRTCFLVSRTFTHSRSRLLIRIRTCTHLDQWSANHPTRKTSRKIFARDWLLREIESFFLFLFLCLSLFLSWRSIRPGYRCRCYGSITRCVLYGLATILSSYKFSAFQISVCRILPNWWENSASRKE